MLSKIRPGTSAGISWLSTLAAAVENGEATRPRGLECLELGAWSQCVDMRYPVVTHAPRKLQYRFMAAEARWILSGDDRVSTIAPWNSKIAEFSDDGEFFFGAYGPKIIAQLPYVVDKLATDPHTRQAVINIWRESPPPTKDVPCTVAMVFRRRGQLLDLHVFMRSSDVWLGLPYDLFNFSMLGHYVAGLLTIREAGEPPTSPGNLNLTTVSTHLYARDLDKARECINHPWLCYSVTKTPDELLNPLTLMETLSRIANSAPGDAARWWG